MSVVLLFVAYAIGCLNPAYYLTRTRTRRDIRETGSGNAGASNAGRLLGPGAFVTVFLLDAAKGAVAVWLVQWFRAAPAVETAAAWFVVAGHIWPAQLEFRGGKGVATLLGALAMVCPASLLGPVFVFPPVFLALRRWTLAGLIALSSAPIAAALFSSSWWPSLTAALLVATSLWAHRSDFRSSRGPRLVPIPPLPLL
jgi:glycerol-3-phosphate acyltransferase PlsY